MEFGTRGIGGEIKLFPPPVYHGELEKWEDWSWQLKRYVGLYKPLAKLLMDDVEGSNVPITDDLCEAFHVQQNRTQNDQLSLFSRQLAYMLAQRERLRAMKIRRMDLRSGGDCIVSFHCLREHDLRIS